MVRARRFPTAGGLRHNIAKINWLRRRASLISETRFAPAEKNPSPPFRGEREGPIVQRWEGEVGLGERPGIPHLTPTLSAPGGGEGVKGEPVSCCRVADHCS